jgi:hypothetical protein
VSGVADTSNVCSDSVHPESCDYLFNGTGERCSCDGTSRPGTCPLGPSSVCAPTPGAGTTSGFHCASCGDAGTNGLACRSGGTCHESSGKCL